MKRDLYAEVTARILSELEAGAVPWVKPWSQTPGANIPRNAVTLQPYSGINVLLLWLTRSRGWAVPHFVTFKQCKDAGGYVRAGEKHTKVYFFKQLEVKDKNAREGENDTKFIPFMREFQVFNIAQCEGLPVKLTDRALPKPQHDDMRDATIDEFLAHTGADIREGAGEAYFAPGNDFISLPGFRAFKSAAQYYATAFHELIHWTGAKSRLDRDLRAAGKGSTDYAAEELVAELGAAFLCAEFNIDGDLRHAGYIGHWIKLLKDDNRAFIKAAARAQKAANYLRDVALADALPAKPPALAA